MQAILVISYLLTFATSIELNLPLNEIDLEKFKVQTQHMCTSSQVDDDLIYFLSYYESLSDTPITKVTYHGVVLFQDETQHESSFRRVVNYTYYKSKIILTIFTNNYPAIFEKGYYIRRDGIYHLLSDGQTVRRVSEGKELTIIEAVLKSIFERKEKKRPAMTDLDMVDDEPVLVKGNTNISPEQLQEDTNNICQKMQVDQSDA